ncbi:MAG: hypothetical protein CFE40_12440 [Burkholderiales bacterium PBB1]|nr:MAG: hypothetical protein CFE40_12440 [Burkholderiales bacterium PBB1]
MTRSTPSDTAVHVPSPCVGVCRMDEADRWCVGCLRSREEIGLWSQMTDRDKLALWADITHHRTVLATPAAAPESDA